MAEQQLQEKLKEVKVKIKANSKDAHFAEALIEELVGLQKQADIEPVELIVPCAEVQHRRTIDDVTELIKTTKGFLYKFGNMSYTFIPFGVNSLYRAMEELDDMLGKNDRTDDEDLTVSMMNRMLQWHTVAFYDTESLIDSATASAKILNDAVERYKRAITAVETEEDIRDNEGLKNASVAIKGMLKQ